MEEYTEFQKWLNNASDTFADKLVDAIKDQVCKDIESEEMKEKIIKYMKSISSSSYCVGFADAMQVIRPEEIKSE